MKRAPRPTDLASDASYEKVSATLDRTLLRMIREKTSNVSAFLNEAARDKLYFQMLEESAAELEREGVGTDEKFYEGLGRWMRARERRLARRSARGARSR
jgi:hypothetical protein